MIRKPAPSFKPHLESLEDRLCLSTITNPALVFVGPGKAGSNANLYVTTADGSATQRLTNGTFEDYSPRWKSDGAQIAFLRWPDSGLPDLYSIRPDGTGLTLLHDFTGTSTDPAPLGGGTRSLDVFTWSPDGTKVVYDGIGGLWALDLATNNVQALIAAQTFAGTYAPTWSPDLDLVTDGYQGMIAFSALVGPADNNNWDILVLNVAIDASGAVQTGQITNLTNTPGLQVDWEKSPRWSPNGKSIAIVEEPTLGTFNLKVVSVEVTGTGLDLSAQITGTTLVVSKLPQQAPTTWSPDSQWIAFKNNRKLSSGKTTSELFRVHPDGTGLTNVSKTDKTHESNPDWNPAWLNDLGSALTAASTASGSAGQTLTEVQVSPILVEALSRWQTAGVDTSALASIDVQIANLGGATLGLTSGHTIWLDDNAAGWGWFVDPTPGDDCEFTTPGDQGEQDRMDLLTTLAHEIGHLFGHEHENIGVMVDTLATGARRTPSAGIDTDWLAAIDLVLHENSQTKRRG